MATPTSIAYNFQDEILPPNSDGMDRPSAAGLRNRYGGEFGRPPEFDSGGGRGHQGKAFTCVLAGGGLNHQGAFGETDALSNNIVHSPLSVPNFFATICAAVGVDPSKNLYDGDRPVPITDNGIPIANLFA